LTKASLRRRVAKLEGAAQAVVTIDELLIMLDRGETFDDPDFARRLAALPIAQVLANLGADLNDEEPAR